MAQKEVVKHTKATAKLASKVPAKNKNTVKLPTVAPIV